jgi:hypothetical protein
MSKGGYVYGRLKALVSSSTRTIVSERKASCHLPEIDGSYKSSYRILVTFAFYRDIITLTIIQCLCKCFHCSLTRYSSFLLILLERPPIRCLGLVFWRSPVPIRQTIEPFLVFWAGVTLWWTALFACLALLVLADKVLWLRSRLRCESGCCPSLC